MHAAPLWGLDSIWMMNSMSARPRPDETLTTVFNFNLKAGFRRRAAASFARKASSTNLVSVTPSCAARPLAWRRIWSFRLSVAFIASLSY